MLRRNFLVHSSIALGMAAARSAFAWARDATKSILDYGARPDGRTMNTRAIQRAIDDRPGKAAAWCMCRRERS